MKFKEIFKKWHFWLIFILLTLKFVSSDAVIYYNTPLLNIFIMDSIFAFFLVLIFYSIISIFSNKNLKKE